MAKQFNQEKSGVRRVSKSGGSRIIALPQGVQEKSGFEVGDNVRIWSPIRNVVMIERVEWGKDNELWPKNLAEMAGGIETTVDFIRAVGKGEIEAEDRRCAICGETHLPVVYRDLALCLKDEKMVAAVIMLQYKGIFDGSKKKSV